MFVTKPKNRNENAVDLKKATRAQLQELLDRQNKILGNRRFVDGLPDKGEKIKQFRLQLESQLIIQNKADQLCNDMASLNIGKEQLDTLEWTGKHLPCMHTNSQSESDDGNILKMFISHSGVNQDKIIIKEKPDEPLIIPSDLIDNEPICKPTENKPKVFNAHVEKYAKNLCGRIDSHKPEKKDYLLLNKPVKIDKYSKVKASELSLKESVILQILHENNLKEIQEERSKERSFAKFNTKNYRDVKVFDCDILDDTDSEVDETEDDNLV